MNLIRKVRFLFKSTIFIVSLLLITGCKDVELVVNLTQKQAIEVVAVLDQNGISSNFVVGKNKKNSAVLVSPGDKQVASSVLHANGLPHEDKIDGLLSSGGLLSDSIKVENARLDRASSIELAEHLGTIKGVVDSSVIVRTNSSFPFDEKDSKNSTGVSISLIYNKDFKTSRDEIKEHVQTLVTQVSKSNIKIFLSSSLNRSKTKTSSDTASIINTKNFIFGSKVRSDSYNSSVFYLILMLLAIVTLGAIAGWFIATKLSILKSATRFDFGNRIKISTKSQKKSEKKLEKSGSKRGLISK